MGLANEKNIYKDLSSSGNVRHENQRRIKKRRDKEKKKK